MSSTAILTFTGGGLLPALNTEDALEQAVNLPRGVTYAQGTVLGQVTAVTLQSEVQTVTITGTPTGGTFVLIFGGVPTAAIAYNANAAAVQAALVLLSSIGAGNVVCTGGPLPGTPVVCTFQGALANAPLPLMTAINSTTGGASPAVTPSETTIGNPGARYYAPYASGNGDGTQNAKAILRYAVTVDTFGNFTCGGGEWGGQSQSPVAPAYCCGTFYTADLTGLDATAVAALGRLISGSTSLLSDAATMLRIG